MRGVTLSVLFLRMVTIFQLTRLMRGVTLKKIVLLCTFKFQLTRLMRGVTVKSLKLKGFSAISTHTPHARRDLNLWQ